MSTFCMKKSQIGMRAILSEAEKGRGLHVRKRPDKKDMEFRHVLH